MGLKPCHDLLCVLSYSKLNTTHLPMSPHGCVGGWQAPVEAQPKQTAYYGFPFSSLSVSQVWVLAKTRHHSCSAFWELQCRYLSPRLLWPVVIAGHISFNRSNRMAPARESGESWLTGKSLSCVMSSSFPVLSHYLESLPTSILTTVKRLIIGMNSFLACQMFTASGKCIWDGPFTRWLWYDCL